jgi:hypothetical protein
VSNGWDALSVAAVGMLICCMVCAVICVMIWSKFRKNFSQQITAGDDAVRAHANAELEDIRESIARIEQRQETEAEHVLRPRDLGRIHEKINALALEGAARGAKSDAQNTAIAEQIKVLQRLVEGHMLNRNP